MIFGEHHDGAPAGAHAAPGKADPDKHKQQLIVIISFVGVIIAYLSYRSIKGGGSASSSPTITPTSGTAYTGTVAGTAQQTGMDAYLSNLSDEIKQLNANVTSGSASTQLPTATPTPFVGTLPASYNNFYSTNMGQPGGAIYGVESGQNGGTAGKVDHITGNDWLALASGGATVGSNYNTTYGGASATPPPVTPAIPQAVKAA